MNIKINSKHKLKSILITKLRRCTISQIYFWNRTLDVSDSFSVHHLAPYTQQQVMLTASYRDQDGTEFHPDPASKQSA